jgi:hypothetical protein
MLDFSLSLISVLSRRDDGITVHPVSNPEQEMEAQGGGGSGRLAVAQLEHVALPGAQGSPRLHHLTPTPEVHRAMLLGRHSHLTFRSAKMAPPYILNKSQEFLF